MGAKSSKQAKEGPSGGCLAGPQHGWDAFEVCAVTRYTSAPLPALSAG